MDYTTLSPQSRTQQKIYSTLLKASGQPEQLQPSITLTTSSSLLLQRASTQSALIEQLSAPSPPNPDLNLSPTSIMTPTTATCGTC